MKLFERVVAEKTKNYLNFKRQNEDKILFGVPKDVFNKKTLLDADAYIENPIATWWLNVYAYNENNPALLKHTPWTTLMNYIKTANISNSLLIIDFNNMKFISDEFWAEYNTFVAQTNNTVLGFRISTQHEWIHPMAVETQDNLITFKFIGDDDITYQTQKNLFEEKTGVTIRNPDVNIPAYGLELAKWGTHLDCGHIIDNVVGFLKGQELENIILVIDFSGVIEVSENFCEQYLKFLLSTKSKVLSIHQNTNISVAFSNYIESVIEYQDVST